MRNVIQIRIRIQDYGSATLLLSLTVERPDGLAGGEVLVVIVVLLPLNDHLDLPRLRVRHYTIREHYREIISYEHSICRWPSQTQSEILIKRQVTRYDSLSSLLANGSKY
jgi:hypothetical protein